jgi:hypothetical protein
MSNRPERAAHAALATLLVFSSPAWTADHEVSPLEPFTAEYGVQWKGISAGTSTATLQRQDDGTYVYESRNLARGVFRLAIPGALTQSTTFTLVDGRIAPRTYRGDDGSDDTKRDVSLDFDWARGRVTGRAEEQDIDVAVTPGVLDPASVQFAQMQAVAAGTRSTEFRIFDKDEVKTYQFRCQPSGRRLSTAIGEFDTVLCTNGRPGSSRSTSIWFAPEAGYLPVRAERRKGDSVELTMTIRALRRGAA